MVLTVSFVLSPVIGLSCHRRLRIMPVSTRSGRHATADLTPASRRQDHTTSPSASASFVGAPFDRSRETRPAITCVPDAAASTASRPHVRDDGQRPSDWDGMAEEIGVIWVRREQKYFYNQGWTANLPNSPSGKSVPWTERSQRVAPSHAMVWTIRLRHEAPRHWSPTTLSRRGKLRRQCT